MKQLHSILIGAPVEEGAGQRGCVMGPDAYRTAGLTDALTSLGHRVTDRGDVARNNLGDLRHENDAIHDLADIVGWAAALQDAAYDAAQNSDLPVFLGGDHSLAIGTVPGVARHAAEIGRPQYVLWLDAHPDLHSLSSTQSGNLHGTPAAYFLGQPGFDGVYPPLPVQIDPANICMMGLRSVDPAEASLIEQLGLRVYDMRRIDEEGIKNPLSRFLADVKSANGVLHVSLDVDFLDPAIAPAVGTTVPGGATFREAHLIMEMLCDSGLVTSLDLVELNPFLDDRGRTALLMVDLCASLFGRKVLGRPTRQI